MSIEFVTRKVIILYHEYWVNLMSITSYTRWTIYLEPELVQTVPNRKVIELGIRYLFKTHNNQPVATETVLYESGKHL